MALKEFLANEEEKVRSIPEKLSCWVKIKLSETDTIFLFGIDGTLVSQYADEADLILARNANYSKLCKEVRTKTDFHRDATIQTCHRHSSGIEMQTDEIVLKDTGSWSTSWDLHDSFRSDQLINNDNIKNEEEDDLNVRLLCSLNLMECLLSLNLHQVALKAYRTNGIRNKTANSNVNTGGAMLTCLWSLSTPLVGNKSATCLTWNTVNKDLLCVGYGSLESNNQSEGMLCCWSLRNLLHPQRCLLCPASVTAISCSVTKPYLTACGLYDGTVMIWDISPSYGNILWDSREHNIYHLGPVWSVKWAQLPVLHRLNHEHVETQESLVTVSEDGKVCQWNFSKCFKKDIFQMTVMNSELYSTGWTTESLMSYEPLLDINFKGATADKYFVSTGLGAVYMCSLLYKDQYLKSYKGHLGPIYKICISPRNDIFLTCSSDWTIKLWQQDQDNELLTLQTSMNPVYDIAWSPFSSTVLASISPNRLDIWDLNVSILEPMVTEKAARKEVLTTVIFSENSHSLFLGNNSGTVNVYLLSGLNLITNETDKLSALVNKLIKKVTSVTC